MKIGFIDYYLDEWHANNYPAWIENSSEGLVTVGYAYALKDADGGLTSEQWCAKYNAVHCLTEDELIEKSDAIIVLSPDNCELHESLSKKALQSGKRTYIDKTFAPDLQTARRIFDTAAEYNTPVWSSSALRFATEYRFPPKNITAISSWGPCGYETYSIHQLEPVMMMMKTEADEVLFTQCQGFYTLLIRFKDGRLANINGMENGSPFMLNIAAEENTVLTADSDFFSEFIEVLTDFIQFGKIPITPEETLSIMAVREAGIIAAATPGKWVKVKGI